MAFKGCLLARPFYFMRHGQTWLNAAGLIGGRLDPPLNQLGRSQALAARAALRDLPFSAVVCSPALRARETAVLAVPGAGLHCLADLRERDWGVLEGRPQSEQCAYLDTPPDGESWAAFLTRVLAALRSAQQVHECPLIVAHSGVWRVLRMLETGTPDGPRIGNAVPVRVIPGTVALAPQHRVSRASESAS